jgi:hypothetical protein
LIDDLLNRPEYGQHFGTIWRNLLAPPDDGSTKTSRDTFGPWLADRFEANYGFDRIVRELLTVEGPIRERPQAAFLLANSENFQPQANQVTASVARIFWGMQLGCAECHKHPFAKWKQDDFWGVAAFFGQLRFTGFKGPGVPSLVETISSSEKEPSIVIPATVRGAGRTVKARYLDGTSPKIEKKGGPLRPTFADWATGAKNPYFARATINRLWGHFFGRGLVPGDNLDDKGTSHPELLRKLEKELIDSEFDLKHLIRCICNSRAYQRSSRPVAGNEKDELFSRMNLKVLTPEAFYDSVVVVSAIDKLAQRSPSNKGKNMEAESSSSDVPSREEFVRFFRAQGDAGGSTEYRQGIPQILRLLNSRMLDGAPVVDQLASREVSHKEAIDVLFLTALSRRPATAEQKRVQQYLEKRKDDLRAGYRGVLWALLNSSEFAINH